MACLCPGDKVKLDISLQYIYTEKVGKHFLVVKNWHLEISPIQVTFKNVYKLAPLIYIVSASL